MPFSDKKNEFGPGAGFGFHAPAGARITTEQDEETEIRTEEGTQNVPDWLL